MLQIAYRISHKLINQKQCEQRKWDRRRGEWKRGGGTGAYLTALAALDAVPVIYPHSPPLVLSPGNGEEEEEGNAEKGNGERSEERR